jgi:hypothetical protein
MIKVLEINSFNMRHIVFYLLLACFLAGCGINTGKNNPDDCPSVDSVCYTAENKDSFIREMYKGVQGDLTQEEVDSIMRDR